VTSSAPTFDLDAYLARIGYDGPRAPTLATLTGVHERHAQTIPFENLDVVLGRPIPLDLPSLERKLIHDRRGGYCFEQNTLFATALRTLGFVVTPLLARVRWGVPAGVTTPQTHMALRVDLDGRPWLADAGFGGTGLMAPLALDRTDVQATRFEPRRLVPHGRNLLQQVQIAGAWTDVYVLHLDDAYPIDFEVANWFTSAHAASRFRQNLMAARAEGDLRYALLNRDFTIRHSDGSAEKRTLASHDELLDVLARHFGLVFARDTRFACAGLVWA
jgi:N-hydroxyarylamine O-acetyltransferase